jgi:hypothetical protein
MGGTPKRSSTKATVSYPEVNMRKHNKYPVRIGEDFEFKADFEFDFKLKLLKLKLLIKSKPSNVKAKVAFLAGVGMVIYGMWSGQAQAIEIFMDFMRFITDMA